MTKVFINPGHCLGYDPGAIGPNGIREVDIALRITEELLMELPSPNADFEVMWGQNDDLGELCQKANEWGADLFISIHCNASDNPQANGTEIFTSRGETKADFLAEDIMKEISNTFPDLYVRSDYSDGDVDKEAGFFVLNHTIMPAVLLETAFISNPQEEEFLNQKLNQQLFAKAIAKGVKTYLARG